MKILEVRNVHEALPRAIQLLEQGGYERESRNGKVRQMPCPVTTIYRNPQERVIFWPQRDANPFFHLYESLWMLAGRRDVAGVKKYSTNMADYSDNGENFHGAYGHRWREHFALSYMTSSFDQLATIAKALKKNPDDRRCVLQMWDPVADLGRIGKDFPCNLTATFQRDYEGRLDITVFCRSNDIIWGAYGANAVQFSMLQEYMALWIGCPIGVYRQVSVNWHAYQQVYGPLVTAMSDSIDKMSYVYNPYEKWAPIDPVQFVPLSGDIDRVDDLINTLLECADTNHIHQGDPPDEPWAAVVLAMLRAHDHFRTKTGEEKYIAALRELDEIEGRIDWIVAGREWLLRRYSNWKMRQGLLDGGLSHP